MGISFKFTAFGILAVAALALFLYFLGNTPQFQMSSQATTPLLFIGGGIAFLFMLFMFVKLAKR